MQNFSQQILILSLVDLEVQFLFNLEFSTELMHYARDSLLRSFSASKDEYVVLPTGGGSTGAI